MAQRISRKEMKHDEFVETGFDVVAWLEEHRRTVLQVGGAVLVAGVLIAAWSAWRSYRQDSARRLLGQGLTTYEQALGRTEPGPTAAPDEQALRRASSLFEQAAGPGPAGDVASFYRGAAELRLGHADRAATLLEEAAGDADEPLLEGAARALAAEAHAQAGRLDRAIEILRGLSTASGAAFPPDYAMLRLGDLLQRQGKTEEAVSTWRRIVTEFATGGMASEAQSRIAAHAPPAAGSTSAAAEPFPGGPPAAAGAPPQ